MKIFFSIIYTLFETMPFFLLFLFPLRSRLRFSNRVNLTFVFFYSAVIFTFCYHYVDSGELIRSSVFMTTVTFMTIAVGLCMVFLRGRFIINIFLLFIIKSYKDIILIMVDSSADLNILKLGEWSENSLMIIKFLFMLLLFPLVYRLFDRFLVPIIQRSEHLKAWRYLWFLPCMFFLGFYTIAYPQLSGEASFHANILLPLIWILSTFLTYYLLLQMLNEALELAQLEEKLRMAEIQAELQQKQYEDLQSYIKKARTVRHDLRHMLLVLDSYAEKGDLDSFCAYIDKIKQERN